MTDLLQKFIQFLDDPEAPDMYIEGIAGTGKTTSLAELMSYCIEHRIHSVTCAYTHKAVGVLRDKLPRETDNNTICTLHSFLKKRPTINSNAVKLKEIEGNSQASVPKRMQVVFLDEFSMVGERDYVDIVDMQYATDEQLREQISELYNEINKAQERGDYIWAELCKKDMEDLQKLEDGDLITKVVYIGDPNQLPPVKDMQTIFPKGDYCIKLTKVYRQAGDNPLIDTLLQLNDMINGASPKPLEEHSNFKRGTDIVEGYKECKTSKVILAYTNACVEDLNAKIEGRDKPVANDILFSPTLRTTYSLDAIDTDCDNIVNIRGEIIERDSKFKTLETLHEISEVDFYVLTDTELRTTQRAVVFGHNSYLMKQQELAKKAVHINKQIEDKYKVPAKDWAKRNWSDELAKKRSKAWREYLTFKECVICIDFTHAMTIHKSQGSTYDNVYLDMEDIGKCADNDYMLYLKLLYVAISRAADTVYTN